MSDLRDKIERLLREYRCQYTQDDDGNGSMLVDVFTPLDYMDIGPGKEEVHLLADMLAAELSAAPEGGLIKRYNIHAVSLGEDPAGEWVRYADLTPQPQNGVKPE